MILDKIVSRKKEEVAELKGKKIQLPDDLKEIEIDPPRGFRDGLIRHEGVSIIAEAKKASPSKGVICDEFNIELIAKHYQSSGAQAISVLTDVDFFQGSLTYMVKAREVTTLPVLRKDFIIDELQIKEASLFGADCILLIAAILERNQIQEYFECARELKMDVLLEVHDEAELEKSLTTSCDLIGVNNRNLNDFSVDIETTFRLQKLMPRSLPLVSESGLSSSHDIERLEEHGVAAALIGESLMRAGMEGDSIAKLRTSSQ